MAFHKEDFSNKRKRNHDSKLFQNNVEGDNLCTTDNKSGQRYFQKFKNEPTEQSENIKTSRYSENNKKPYKKFKNEQTKYSKEIQNDRYSENEVEPYKFTYFEKILQTLKTGLPDDSKDLFVINALEETKDQEVSLSCLSSTSQCIELLLSLCKDSEIWKSFMISFAKDKETVCTNPNASHILELLLLYSVQNIENWSLVLSSEEDSNEKLQISFFVSWIDDFGSFILSNLINCLTNPYASHIACSVVRALGGDTAKFSESTSKRSLNHKKDFSSKYIGTENPSSILFSTPVVLETIPKFFKKTLKKIAKFAQQIEDVSDYANEGYCATFFETLIDVVKQRLPKYYNKFIKRFSTQLLSTKDNEGIPLACKHKNSSFVVEKLFQASDENSQEFLWNNYFVDNLHLLIVHPISNYIVQKLFNAVQNQSQLQIMCEKTGEVFDEILQVKHYGIFLSISEACLRLKAHQGLFLKCLMQCLQCSETEQKQLKIVQSLLSFKKFCGDDSELYICLQGSLLVQKLLMFQKPIKLVNSMLNMKPQELAYLACHTQGCYVLTSFFEGSTVGEKNKDKLVQSLQPVIINLVSDANGNLTMARIWTLLTIKQKSVVANVILKNEETIKSSKIGNIIYNKFKIFHYKYKFEEWKEMQLKLFSKRDVKKTK